MRTWPSATVHSRAQSPFSISLSLFLSACYLIYTIWQTSPSFTKLENIGRPASLPCALKSMKLECKQTPYLPFSTSPIPRHCPTMVPKRKHTDDESSDDEVEKVPASETSAVGGTKEADHRATKARFKKKYKTAECSNEAVLGA